MGAGLFANYFEHCIISLWHGQGCALRYLSIAGIRRQVRSMMVHIPPIYDAGGGRAATPVQGCSRALQAGARSALQTPIPSDLDDGAAVPSLFPNGCVGYLLMEATSWWQW